MVGFLEKTLLSKDQDGDNVADAIDKCPNTMKDVLAQPDGCTPDTDSDGVYDYLDRCPNTPHGLRVDKVGCPFDEDADGAYDDHDRCPKASEWINNFKYGCPSENRYIRFDVADYEIKPYLGVKVPEGCDWEGLKREAGTDLLDHYTDIMRTLLEAPGLLGDIFVPRPRRLALMNLFLHGHYRAGGSGG